MTPSRGPDTRGAIAAAALELFNTRGVEATSINEICERSGASVGSVYHWFNNKEGIASAILLDALRGNNAELLSRLPDARTPREGVEAVIGGLLSWVTDNPAEAHFVYAVTAGPSGEAQAKNLQAIARERSEAVDGFFAPLRVGGVFKIVPDEVWSSILLGPSHDHSRRWLTGQCVATPKTHEALFVETAWISLAGNGSEN